MKLMLSATRLRKLGACSGSIYRIHRVCKFMGLLNIHDPENVSLERLHKSKKFTPTDYSWLANNLPYIMRHEPQDFEILFSVYNELHRDNIRYCSCEKRIELNKHYNEVVRVLNDGIVVLRAMKPLALLLREMTLIQQYEYIGKLAERTDFSRSYK